jgi:Domain of unknown function (DUF4382)
MTFAGGIEAAATLLRKVSPSLLLLCLALSGCGTTCFSGFWNGNGSGAAVSNSSCPFTPATGSVVVQMSTTSAILASPIPSPHEVRHIFITLRGIEAHPGKVADEDSSAWRELAADLASHPVQLDLLAVSGDSRSPSFDGHARVSTTVPADEYRQLRLRLVSLHPSPEDPTPENNVCGNVGWNCIVFADRSISPLDFESIPVKSQSSAEHGNDHLFRVLPAELVHLNIQLDAASSVLFTSNAPARFLPVFTVTSRTLPSTGTMQ